MLGGEKMNKKMCIFDKSKACDDCGECYICDLDANKRCNNCGKCLELEGYDIKAIKIDEIFESNEELVEFEKINSLHNESNKKLNEDEEFWDYIDDIKEVKDFLQNENNIDLYEEYPGLISLNNKKSDEK